MSPLIVRLSGIRPPAPSPCTARNAISCVIDCEAPDNAEPIRKKATPARYKVRRPYRSDSLPQSGTVTVEARRYAEKTQLYLFKPPSEAITVGIAVPTT